MRQSLNRCVIGLAAGLAAVSAWSAACFLSPKAGEAPSATIVQDGNEQLALSGARAFDNCERVVITRGLAVAQYLDKHGKLRTEEISQGKRISVANLAANAAPVRAVARGLLDLLTDAKERRVVGQKYFEDSVRVGAPFGDVYIPPQGLAWRFVNLEGDARVQIVNASTHTTVLEAVVAQGLILDRGQLRAGETYTVQVLTSRGKLPPGAFEVVSQELSNDLDQTLKAIDADQLLDANTRPIARALVFEREGLSFNRELALREKMK